MLTFVFHHPEADGGHLYLYILAGYVLWSFIASTITSSTTVIQRRFDFAVHNNLTLPGLFFKLLIDRLFSLGLDLILLFSALLILSPENVGVEFMLMPLLIVLLALVSIAVAYIVNLAVILFPDLDAIFGVGVRFMFFVSPVFWGAGGDVSGLRAVLIAYNPAAYFLSIFRQAFGITPFSSSTWIITIALSLGLCIVSLLAYNKSQAFVRNLK